MEYFKHRKYFQELCVLYLGSVRMSDLHSAVIQNKISPHMQCCYQLQWNMTIAMENAQLFGEKYDHLNGADT